jgi:predicted NUDIX family NTP pyrophosphohydrolase
MSKSSAGLLLYRYRQKQLQVFLVHPGGPFWARKDEGAWSIPKGEFDSGEDALAAARREFEEETGFKPEGDFIELPPAKQSSAKTVYAWAVQGDCDPQKLQSNTFTMQWPPKSGQQREFPEVDKGGWFTITEAKGKMVKGQRALLEELERLFNQ